MLCCAQTFFFEGSAQRELAILKEMTSGKFRHENLCTVLHVCVEKAPVQSHSGELVYVHGCIPYPLKMKMNTLPLTVGRLLTHSSYVVFEYCSGTDLFNFLVTGPFEKINR